MRVTKKQMDNAVFVPTKNKDKVKDINVLIDKAGNEQEYLPEDQVMARYFHDTKTGKYFVRVNTEGRMYDPYDKNYVDRSYKMTVKNGQDPFKMKSTSKKVYDLYVNFLKTKKREFLFEAEKVR